MSIANSWFCEGIFHRTTVCNLRKSQALISNVAQKLSPQACGVRLTGNLNYRGNRIITSESLQHDCMYIHMFMYTSLNTCPCIHAAHMSVHIHIHTDVLMPVQSLCTSLCTCMHTGLLTYLWSTHMSVHISMHMPAHMSLTCLCTCMYTYLWTFLNSCLCTCLCIRRYMPVHVS